MKRTTLMTHTRGRNGRFGARTPATCPKVRMIAWLFVVTAVIVFKTAGVAHSSEVVVTATVTPRVVAVGGEVTLVVSVEGKFRKSVTPELPPLDDFSVYQAGTSQQFSFGAGGARSTLEFTYVLVPKTEGTFTIEPVRFRVGDNTYTADPVTLEVVKSADPAQSQVQAQPPDAPTMDGGGVDGEDRPIFIRATMERDTVYVNQQVTWTLGFYTDGRINLVRTPEFSPPTAEGFWVEDLPPQKNYYQQIAGRRYLVNELKRGLFATTPGEFTIGAARVDLVIDETRRRSANDLFDDFFGRRLNTFGFGKPVTLTTEETAVTVLPLPKNGRPAGFSGLVGRGLTLSAVTDKTVAQVGEPVNLTIEIRGEGNFKTMSAPALPGPAGFKMYESGSTSDLFKKDYVVAGRKKYEYVLVPKFEGDKTIPPVTMSYFDPIAKAYRRIQSAPVHLEIMPGTEDSGRRVVFAGSGNDIEVLGQDINYIHAVPAMVSVSTKRAFPKRIIIALHAIPLVALFMSVVIERRRRRWRDDVSYARYSRAAREADKKFKEARRVHKKGLFADVYAVVSEGVRGYFADKMNVPAPGITGEDLERFFAAKNVGEDSAQQAKSILRACDGARYAPVKGSGRDAEDARRVIESAGDIVRDFEKRYLS